MKRTDQLSFLGRLSPLSIWWELWTLHTEYTKYFVYISWNTWTLGLNPVLGIENSIQKIPDLGVRDKILLKARLPNRLPEFFYFSLFSAETNGMITFGLLMWRQHDKFPGLVVRPRFRYWVLVTHMKLSRVFNPFEFHFSMRYGLSNLPDSKT
jgi:hypothetical protein